MYLGAEPTAALTNNVHSFDKCQVHNVWLRCLEFYIEAAHEILTRLTLKSDQMKILGALDPKAVVEKDVEEALPETGI